VYSQRAEHRGVSVIPLRVVAEDNDLEQAGAEARTAAAIFLAVSSPGSTASIAQRAAAAQQARDAFAQLSTLTNAAAAVERRNPSSHR
jgi:ABC-type branched-subunit amino acid transport system substrate-binding protein